MIMRSFFRVRFVLTLAAVYASGLSVYARQQLHIHHINIGNGDATMVGIYDEATKKYTSKILIDGGKSTPEDYLLPYLEATGGTEADPLHFNYVVLTHYHNDHYNGLFALKTGRITADSIIDPGGYDLETVFGQHAGTGTPPSKLDPRDTWLKVLTTAAQHRPVPYVKGHSTIMLHYEAEGSTCLARKITLGKVGNDKVVLQVIAGWGNTLSENGEIMANPYPTRDNPNNYTLAFLLTCGEFRYFIGGDMGGDNKTPYIDQEKAVSKFLADEYPLAYSIDGAYWAPGHVCGFKANHHGSDHSNQHDFITNMFPAVTVTSAGDDSGWHLPHPDYIDRLGLVTPLSELHDAQNGSFDRGVYFTNLYDFTDKGRRYPSMTAANNLFRNKPGISYDYGNAGAGTHGSYLLKVSASSTLRRQSAFEVERVDINGEAIYKSLAIFQCHTIH